MKDMFPMIFCAALVWCLAAIFLGLDDWVRREHWQWAESVCEQNGGPKSLHVIGPMGVAVQARCANGGSFVRDFRIYESQN